MPRAAAIMLVGTAGRPSRWLVVRRPEAPFEWSIPGGLVERGETPLRAAVRETREETGVIVSQAERLGLWYDRGRPVHIYMATAARGRPYDVEGVGGVGWATWPQLRVQAQRFGTSLDAIAQGIRGRYGISP